MKLKMIGLIAALALVPAAAFAQGSGAAFSPTGALATTPAGTMPGLGASNFAAGTPSRDGCVNVPGEAHSSTDCAKIDATDRNTSITPATDLSGQPTGATENAARTDRILSGQSPN